MEKKKKTRLVKDAFFLYGCIGNGRLLACGSIISLIVVFTIAASYYPVFSLDNDILNFSSLNIINGSTASDRNIQYDELIGCNCVVFRMDDVQDYWLNDVQTAVMNLFLNKNHTISLGLIMNSIGNDSKVVEMVKQGVDRNLFELSLHGWNHTGYVNLTEQEQEDSLLKSNSKMHQIFGKRSSTFIPPLSVFNNDTLKSMVDLDLNIISSDIPEETKFNHGRSIFVAKNHHFNDTVITTNQKEKNHMVYHMPATIFFKDFEKGDWIKTPNNVIIANSTNNIEKYGYSIIVLHPQDFALLSNDSRLPNPTYANYVNKPELDDLSDLIDTLVSENIRILGFEQVVKGYSN